MVCVVRFPKNRMRFRSAGAEMRRQGADATVVAWSAAVALAEEAAEALASEGVEAEVINLRTLIPFDKASVLNSVRKTGRLVIVQEAVRRGGVGAEIAAAVVESEAFGYLQAPIVRVANPGVPVPHSAALHRFAFPHKDDVIAAVRHVVSYT